MKKTYKKIDPKQLGEVLKTLRKAKGLSQSTVAEYLGVERTTYTKYELGKMPDVSVIAKLSAFYNVSTDGILSVFFEETSADSHTAVLNAVDEKTSLYLLNEDERKLIEAFRLCTNKDTIIDFAQGVYLEESAFADLDTEE